MELMSFRLTERERQKDRQKCKQNNRCWSTSEKGGILRLHRSKQLRFTKIEDETLN
jgi:ribosomal protein S14